MKVAAGMGAASVASWAVVAALVDRPARAAVLFGMLGPLVVAAASWLMAERAWRRSPESLTPLMVTAFGAKMLFFGGYVTAMLKGAGLAAIPFVVSFASYFIALYIVEAVALKRLFDGGGDDRLGARGSGLGASS